MRPSDKVLFSFVGMKSIVFWQRATFGFEFEL